MKKALVCDWFDTNSGAEKCVKSFCEIWDDFELFSLVDFFTQFDREDILKNKSVNTSPLQNFPFSKKHFRKFLPLFPYFIENFDLGKFDLILSSSHCVAKGILTNQNQLHICYMHTPMRYIWDLYPQYSKNLSFVSKFLLHKLRIWDFISTNRVNKIIANSEFVARRIKKIYGRKSKIIYPPVDTEYFTLHERKEDYYIVISRLVPYKKIDLLVRAFNQNQKKLLVIGNGSELDNLKSIAKPNIEFLGWLDKNDILKYLQNAKAFVYAAIEDFGISPVEAMSCGTPVIAFGEGGVKESVQNNGILFHEQNEESLNKAIIEFEKKEFDYRQIRQNVLRFSKERFYTQIKQYVESEYEKFSKRIY